MSCWERSRQLRISSCWLEHWWRLLPSFYGVAFPFKQRKATTIVNLLVSRPSTRWCQLKCTIITVRILQIIIIISRMAIHTIVVPNSKFLPPPNTMVTYIS